MTVSLPEGFEFRPISLEDKKDLVKVLSVLTEVGNVTDALFEELYAYWQKNSDTYNPIVIYDTKKQQVAATGMLLVEQKLIHAGAKLGHIEDIAVSSEYQGMKLGKALIDKLTEIAIEDKGCYKTVLYCAEKNVGFYEKCSYKRDGVEMSKRK